MEDFALLRSDGMPTYHLASCVDDADLRISHIIRGQDHLTNTFKHLLIFEALGARARRSSRICRLLVAPDGTKLSKRKHGPVVSVTTYRDAGFLPQAFINFLCLLGWSPKNDREFHALDEIRDLFTLEGVNRANAVVNFTEEDPVRCESRLAQRRTHPRLAGRGAEPRDLQPFFEQAGFHPTPEKLLAVTPLIRERIKLLRDAVAAADFFFVDELAPYDPAELIPLKKGESTGDAALARVFLQTALEVLAATAFDHDSLDKALREAAASLGLKAGPMFQPIRVAVCGRKNAPPLFETMVVLGRDVCLARIGQAEEHLKTIGLNRWQTARHQESKQGFATMTNGNSESPATKNTETPTSATFSATRSPKMCAPKSSATQSCRRAFLLSPTATCTSATPRQSALTSGSPTSSAARPICASTIPIPKRKRQEYVDSIKNDVRWLGFDWEQLCYASDYFGQLYEWALQLIKAGKAYVDDLTADEIRQHRGTLTEPGKDSPYRNRTIDENLDLFVRMKKGEFPDGSRVLRAKIDMGSPNLNMRDPVMYRILHATHHRTGDEWCIYPMYDFAHGQSDSIERVTHSMCTLEFADHQPLYRWYIEQLGIFPSQQIEFDRLNITYTLLSKRKLLQLVQENRVHGWDDPRMPTLSRPAPPRIYA